MYLLKISDKNLVPATEQITAKTNKIYNCVNATTQEDLNNSAMKRAKSDLILHLREGNVLTDNHLQLISVCRLGTKKENESFYRFVLNQEAQQIYKNTYINEFNEKFPKRIYPPREYRDKEIRLQVTWANRFNYIDEFNNRERFGADIENNFNNQAPQMLNNQAPQMLNNQAPQMLNNQAPQMLNNQAPQMLNNQAPQMLNNQAPQMLNNQAIYTPRIIFRVNDNLNISEDDLSLFLVDEEIMSKIFTVLLENTQAIKIVIGSLLSPKRIKPTLEANDHANQCSLKIALFLLENKNEDNAQIIERELLNFFNYMIQVLRVHAASTQTQLKEDGLVFIQQYIEKYKKTNLISAAYSLCDYYEPMQKWFDSFFETNPDLKKEYETNLINIQNAILSEKEYTGNLANHSIADLLAKRSLSEYLNFISSKIISPKVPFNRTQLNPLQQQLVGRNIPNRNPGIQQQAPGNAAQLFLMQQHQLMQQFQNNPRPQQVVNQQPVVNPPPQIGQPQQQFQQPMQQVVNHQPVVNPPPQIGQPQQQFQQPMQQVVNHQPVVNPPPQIGQPQQQFQQPMQQAIIQQPEIKLGENGLTAQNFQNQPSIGDFLQSNPEENYILRVKEPILIRALSLLIKAFPDATLIETEENLFILVLSYYFKNLLSEQSTSSLDDGFLLYFKSRKSLIFGGNNQPLALLNNLPLYLQTHPIDSSIRPQAYRLIEAFFGKRFTQFITDASEIVQLEIAVKLFDDPNDLAFFLLPVIFNLKETFLERVRENRPQFIKLYDDLANLFPKNELFQARLNQAFHIRYPSTLITHKIAETKLNDNYPGEYQKAIELFKAFMLNNPSAFGIEKQQIDSFKNIDNLTIEKIPRSLAAIKSAFLVMQQIYEVANNSNENRYRLQLLLSFLALIQKPLEESKLPTKLTQLSQLYGQCNTKWIDILSLVNDIVLVKPSNQPKDILNQKMDIAINEAALLIFHKPTIVRNAFGNLFNLLESTLGLDECLKLLSGNFVLEAHLTQFFEYMSTQNRAKTFNDHFTNVLFSPIKIEEKIKGYLEEQQKIDQQINLKIQANQINQEELTFLNQKFDEIMLHLAIKNERIDAISRDELGKKFSEAGQKALNIENEKTTALTSILTNILGATAAKNQKEEILGKINYNYKKLSVCFLRLLENDQYSDLFDPLIFKECLKKEIIKATFPEFIKIIGVQKLITDLKIKHIQVFNISTDVASNWTLPIAINRLYRQLTDFKSMREQYNPTFKILLKLVPANVNKNDQEIYQEHFVIVDEDCYDFKLKFSSFLLLLINSKLITLDYHEQFFPNQFTTPKKRKVVDLSNEVEEGFEGGYMNSPFQQSFFTPPSPSHQNKGYSKREGLLDIYSAFGIDRKIALEVLSEKIADNKVQVLLANAIKDALINHSFSGFVNYLIKKEETYGQRWSEKKSSEISHDIRKNLSSLSSNLTIISYYLSFDVAEKGINDGAHPAVLQTLAHILDISLNIWQIGDNQKLIPHEFSEYAKYPAKPNPNQQRIDLLQNPNGDFEVLDIVGGFEGNIYPLNQNIPRMNDNKEPSSPKKRQHNFFADGNELKKQKTEEDKIEIKKETDHRNKN